MPFLSSAPASLFGRQLGALSASTEETPTHATHVLGLEHFKRGAKGRLIIAGKELRFESGASVATISIQSIQDVFTGEENQQLVRGKTGLLVELAMPYESSRIVSLLASRKVDILTLEYRDTNGGIHGVIFTLPKGQAAALMRLLVGQGANAVVAPGATAKPHQRESQGVAWHEKN
ncbi:MAG TPA: hypothetical protein VNM47_03165 [Terriglobia bacterium]|nr:hypothetical protein [Terriglobia bacterium]